MEANNHFNYGPHSSVSANSGLKHSSGDSLYTNGSSMSFPQQGKNLNGEMNVNGITTAGGSSQPGGHPPSSSYPHMSNHHLPGSIGYDYLWGQSQYNPAMGPVPPHGLHQKPGTQGGIQPQQPQHHFQGHGPYQVNGSVGPARQPPGAGPQYWGRGNPGQQQQQQGGSSMSMGFNSHSMYGTYPNQGHPGIPPSQHHQQPPAVQHQSATAHHLQHHSHHHSPQHQQQQQHYGMMPNGMPYYQHPSHQSQPQAQTQSQAQTQMIPPAAQSFTPPRGSPQHHHVGSGGGRSSPHHMQVPMQVPMRSPSAMPDSGSPKSKEMQVHMNESFKETDKGFNGVERSSVPQRLSKPEGFPVSSTDYNQGVQHPAVDLEKPAKQHQEIGAAANELSSSPVSGPPPLLASPPRKTSTLPHQTVSGPVSGQNSHSPSSSGFALSTASGVGANTSVSPPSPLASLPQTVQGQRPGFSAPSSADGTPVGLCTTPSMSSPKSSRAPPAVSHSQSVVFSSNILTHPSTVPVPPQTVPLAEAQGSKSPQVSPTPLSLAASPSVVSAPPALAPLKGPQEASPLTGQSPKHPAASSTPTSAADNISLPAVSALPSVVSGSPLARASSAPSPAVSFSSQASAASLNVSPAPNVSRSLVGSAAQPSDIVANFDKSRSPGQVGSHGVVRYNFGESQSTQKTPGKHEACGSQSKAEVIIGTSNTEAQSEMNKVQTHGRNLEPAFVVPKEPERDTMAVGRKDSYSIKDQATPRKGESDTLNDTFGTDTSLDYPSLAESTYLESSRAEDGTSMMDTFDNSYSLSQTGDQSKFTEGSMFDDSRDLQETSCEEENLNSSMTSTSSTEEASLIDNTSLLDDSLNNTSQNCSSLLSPSINASTHSIKGDQILGPDTSDLSGGDRRSALSAMTAKALQVVVSGSVEGTATHISETLIAMPSKKPRKPKTPKIPVAIAEIGSPDSKIKKRKLSPDGPKQEKVRRRKKTEENTSTAVKKRKISKESKEQESIPTDTSNPSNAPLYLPSDPLIFVHDSSLTNNESPIVQPKKIWKRKMKEGVNEAKPSKPAKTELAEGKADDDDNSSTAGDTPRRRIATEEQVQFPLQHGWKREIRVRRFEDRLKGETWYYSPCGRRMKQFPEVIKYLKRHQDGLQGVSREHFSFSPRMPVGDFYEERETPEGMKWFLLANEEVPSMIMAITGRRGRPPNPDKEPRSRGRRVRGAQGRRPGRPPKAKMEDLLSKVDARLLKRLEAKEDLTEEEKEKLVKIKKKMKRKARMKRKEDAKIKKIRQEKRKAKLEKAKEQEQADEDQTQSPSFESPLSAAEGPKKPGRRRKVAVPVPVAVAVAEAEALDPEKASPIKRVARARSKAKALAKAQAQAEAEAQAALAAKRQAERRAQAQRRMEERKRQQMILEEMKKPAEDMCLPDHTLLPALSRVPGLVLSGLAFSNCLRVVEFLHGYGKILGLQVPKDIPSLSTLQEGLLGMEKSQGELLDLLIKLVEAALHDPGLPSYYQSVKILGEKLVDLELSHNTVSEVLRIFLEAHGFELEVCNSLRTKSFQTLNSDVKASILAFLVEELNASNIVTREIDNTLENMATYRKNKWIIEGKLRKLKAALVRKTGRSEEELCFEERRRSARVGMTEEESIEESCVLERGSRRKAKEEPKNTEIESPNTCSVAELERQIDKLTKRQVFFRKKLLQSSHSMRAVSLGQDRYRRRYLLLPYMGCILVEGAEDILASGEVTVSDEPVTYVKVITPVKTEVKAEPPLSPGFGTSRASSPRISQLSPTEVDPLPGEASLMSSPRGRGRPRKIKPEVELHLRAAKNRRRRRSSRSAGEDSALNSPVQELAKPAFQAPLEQQQDTETDGSTPIAASGAGQGEDNSQPEDSMREQAEKRGQWFNLLPKEPCDEASLSQPCENTPAPTSPLGCDPLAAPPLQPPMTQMQMEAAPLPLPVPQVCSTPAPAPRAGRRRRRGSGPSRVHSRSSTAKRRGRPPSNLFQEVELKYFTQLMVKPIPLEMVKGWWWIKEPEELTAILSALHPRGIRERVLHKHLTKHMEYLAEVCRRPVTDPIFQMTVEDGDALLEASKQAWSEQERAVKLDISVLQWVEDLEQRVVGADLQLKVAIPNTESETEASQESSSSQFQIYTPPEADSTREDLQYYEHEVDPKDDWMVKTKKEWSDLLRVPNNPLDLAVLRLTNLERNVERRYLKEPLWNLAEVVRLAPLTPPPGGEEVPLDAVSLESEITPRLRTWRQALDRCRSASQLSLCLLQLEKAIAWERSIIKVTCQVCRKGDDDEYLLLCDGCDRGCHMFCLRPKVMQVPEGDWFCPTCVAKENGDTPRSQRSSRQRSKARKRRLAEDSSDEDDGYKRGMTTRQKDTTACSSGTSISPSKRRRMTTRNQPDLTYCEIILMEMEAHSDAWPFLEPVNPRLVPGYRRIVKNPMDFLTMRERLLQGGYCSCEEFAADAQLVFNNCELFNEDTSEVGKAGHSMRRFFESRWAEFYENKDK
ncbi:LOW QUALITY PROTEIN: bromodomain adjacent to zinc finger domain protein 2A [Ctenopharyngodon idella]|uniref:LOW QUALITY PROTEIN: bromodomain adjacent to zinc finger domain protein 2A n=1 Tax=Ctenopharyngodon idella TaxID=7959 RepID=UPI002230C9DE|nr:LOW QUALITY PROTEIN: bromodomain adjacent to zinc finger domain protein 2A [Ctenopharyngodon idella]